jgi:hypothetical protein
MTYLSRSVMSVLAAIALASASSVSAQTVSPTGAITVSGDLNQSLAGTLLTQCHVVFQGTADAAGFTLTSYTGTNLNGGPLACDNSIVFPLRIDALSSTSLNLESITISTRLGDCSGSNIPLTWQNPPASSVTFPVGTAIGGVCDFDGTLTVSPSTTIN